MIARAARQLPPGMPSPPSYQKVNPADQPILFLTLSSPTLPLSLVDQYAESVLAQRLSMVSGVAASTCSARRSSRCASTSIRRSWPRGRSASTRSRRRSPPRTSTGRPARSTARSATSSSQTSGQLMAAEEYRPIVVAYRNGSPVRLERSRQRLRRRREPAQRELVQRHADDLPRDLAPAGHQHRPGRRRDQGSCCRNCRRSCRRRCSSASAATVRCRSASRSTTSSSRCC